MRKIFLVIMWFSCMFATDGYGLNSNSHKRVDFCINMNGVKTCETPEEKEVYKLIYDLKYDSFLALAWKILIKPVLRIIIL